MRQFSIWTDAESMTVQHAADSDDAASQFAGRPTTALQLLRDYAAIGDGAWCWMEDEDGDRIGGGTPDALADYLAAAKEGIR